MLTDSKQKSGETEDIIISHEQKFHTSEATMKIQVELRNSKTPYSLVILPLT